MAGPTTMKDATTDAKKQKDQNGHAAGAATLGIDAAMRAEILGMAAPEGAQELSQVFLYKPEHFVASTVNGSKLCYRKGPKGEEIPTAPPIQGYPFAVIARQGKGPKAKDYWQIAIELTKPTFVRQGADDNYTEVLVEAGKTVIVTSTAALEMLEEIAQNPTVAQEVYCRPVQKDPIGNNQDLWRWSVKKLQNQKQRQMLPAAPTDKQLPPELED